MKTQHFIFFLQVCTIKVSVIAVSEMYYFKSLYSIL